MKMVGVLFIAVLFLGVAVSTRAQALQLDCPFPEGTVEWQDAEKKYICKLPAAVATPPPTVPTY